MEKFVAESVVLEMNLQYLKNIKKKKNNYQSQKIIMKLYKRGEIKI